MPSSHLSTRRQKENKIKGDSICKDELMTEPTYDELKARLAELEKQVDTKKRAGTMEFRVSEKGGVSVYGLGRFPVTLYYEQWTRLLNAADDLKKFLEENKSKLKLKQG
jgi:ribosome-interacting GTPase 1